MLFLLALALPAAALKPAVLPELCSGPGADIFNGCQNKAFEPTLAFGGTPGHWLAAFTYEASGVAVTNKLTEGGLIVAETTDGVNWNVVGNTSSSIFYGGRTDYWFVDYHDGYVKNGAQNVAIERVDGKWFVAASLHDRAFNIWGGTNTNADIQPNIFLAVGDGDTWASLDALPNVVTKPNGCAQWTEPTQLESGPCSFNMEAAGIPVMVQPSLQVFNSRIYLAFQNNLEVYLTSSADFASFGSWDVPERVTPSGGSSIRTETRVRLSATDALQITWIDETVGYEKALRWATLGSTLGCGADTANLCLIGTSNQMDDQLCASPDWFGHFDVAAAGPTTLQVYTAAAVCSGGDFGIYWRKSTNNREFAASHTLITGDYVIESAANKKGVANQPSVAGDGAGTWVIVWQQRSAASTADNNLPEESDIHWALSTDDAETFTYQGALNHPTEYETAAVANVAPVVKYGGGEFTVVWASRDAFGSAEADKVFQLVFSHTLGNAANGWAYPPTAAPSKSPTQQPTAPPPTETETEAPTADGGDAKLKGGGEDELEKAQADDSLWIAIVVGVVVLLGAGGAAGYIFVKKKANASGQKAAAWTADQNISKSKSKPNAVAPMLDMA